MEKFFFQLTHANQQRSDKNFKYKVPLVQIVLITNIIK